MKGDIKRLRQRVTQERWTVAADDKWNITKGMGQECTMWQWTKTLTSDVEVWAKYGHIKLYYATWSSLVTDLQHACIRDYKSADYCCICTTAEALGPALTIHQGRNPYGCNKIRQSNSRAWRWLDRVPAQRYDEEDSAELSLKVFHILENTFLRKEPYKS